MKMTLDCPKCGEKWITPSYKEARYETGEKQEERLVYRCSCGYSWTSPTLDSIEKKLTQKEEEV